MKKEISQSINTDSTYIIVIILIWIVMVVLINPIGDFPLNDDWAFAHSVKTLLETGKIKLSAWGAPNLITQVFWGALFCLPFGFSFTALRFSTLTLGLIGLIATYKIFREIGLRKPLALSGILVIAFNPIYFGLSNTFMTDVPFFGLAILSLYFLLISLKRESKIALIFGIILACLSLLIRQLGIAVLLAFSFAYIYQKGINFKNIVKGFSPAIIGFFVNFLYKLWLRFTSYIPTPLEQASDFVFQRLLGILDDSSISRGILEVSFNTFMYLGLFILPFILLITPLHFKQVTKSQKIPVILFCLAFCALILQYLWSAQKFMPTAGNILTRFGFSPILLRDFYYGLNREVSPFPKTFWIIITLISVIGFSIIILYLFSTFKSFLPISKKSANNQRVIQIFILMSFLIYLLPIAINYKFYDRYILLLIPLLMIIMVLISSDIHCLKITKLNLTLFSVFIALYAIFTIGITHDYLAWNRVRWQALNYLTKEAQVSPREIDGGFEFNGWYLYSPGYEKKSSQEKSLWWVDRDTYLISFGLVEGYNELRKYPVSRWFPFSPTQIYILQKNSTG